MELTRFKSPMSIFCFLASQMSRDATNYVIWSRNKSISCQRNLSTFSVKIKELFGQNQLIKHRHSLSMLLISIIILIVYQNLKLCSQKDELTDILATIIRVLFQQREKPRRFKWQTKIELYFSKTWVQIIIIQYEGNKTLKYLSILDS